MLQKPTNNKPLDLSVPGLLFSDKQGANLLNVGKYTTMEQSGSAAPLGPRLAPGHQEYLAATKTEKGKRRSGNREVEGLGLWRDGEERRAEEKNKRGKENRKFKRGGEGGKQIDK